ncbi:hypothetical protein [Candidatus Uabimicrobium sp. HlEnr_7]|uniref:hypothetical protein n=1 Tax=Candidatus Uabimicrobium helgolandensis TaxID=3095367 RepID=UPI003558E70B
MKKLLLITIPFILTSITFSQQDVISGKWYKHWKLVEKGLTEAYQDRANDLDKQGFIEEADFYESLSSTIESTSSLKKALKQLDKSYKSMTKSGPKSGKKFYKALTTYSSKRSSYEKKVEKKIKKIQKQLKKMKSKIIIGKNTLRVIKGTFQQYRATLGTADRRAYQEFESDLTVDNLIILERRLVKYKQYIDDLTKSKKQETSSSEAKKIDYYSKDILKDCDIILTETKQLRRALEKDTGNDLSEEYSEWLESMKRTDQISESWITFGKYRVFFSTKIIKESEKSYSNLENFIQTKFGDTINR